MNTKQIIIVLGLSFISTSVLADNTCNHGCDTVDGGGASTSSASSSSNATSISGATAISGAIGVGGNSTSSSAGGSGGNASASGGNISSGGNRTVAIGAAAIGSPANDTCVAYTSILFGAATVPVAMESCVALSEAVILSRLGQPEAAIDRLCQLASIAKTRACQK